MSVVPVPAVMMESNSSDLRGSIIPRSQESRPRKKSAIGREVPAFAGTRAYRRPTGYRGAPKAEKGQ